MRRKKIVSMLLVATMAATLFAGCGNDSGKKGGTETGSAKEFDAFFAVPGSEINDDNEIQKIIEEKTGVRVKETWLTGQTADEAIGTMIAGGEYPDFIEGASGQMQLYDAGALVPLDDYIEKYPNIKNLFTDLEWEKLRQDDGHIYWIPQFSCIKGDEKVCAHNDEAFWIQARVLKWAGYPKIDTLDKYFDLIEKYNEANPKMADGTENIPYTILCDDWRYFCLENAPQFLDGYPNDGSCMVDPDTKKVLDYNTSDTAVKYFKKLNEEYQKGIVDPESFTQTYDEYISKLSTGRVLGMIDQWWDFAYTAGDAIKQAGLDEQGCDYIPVPVTIDGRDNQWHNAGGAFNESTGLAVTTSCDDVDAAMKFVNDLLDQDIHNLRFWGVKGTDYEASFTKQQMRENRLLIQHTRPLIHAHTHTSHSTMEQVMMESMPTNLMDRQESSMMVLTVMYKRLSMPMVLRHTLKCLEQTMHLETGIRCGHSLTTLTQALLVE